MENLMLRYMTRDQTVVLFRCVSDSIVLQTVIMMMVMIFIQAMHGNRRSRP